MWPRNCGPASFHDRRPALARSANAPLRVPTHSVSAMGAQHPRDARPMSTSRRQTRARLLMRSLTVLVIDRDPDLARIAQLQEGLIREVRRNEAKIKSLLRIASLEYIAHPEAHRPAAAPVTDAHILQIVGTRGLRIARVVIETVERRSVQAREPAARVVILGGSGQLVAGRERLRPPVDLEAGEQAAHIEIARAQQREAARQFPAAAEPIRALRFETIILAIARVLRIKNVVQGIVLLQLLG